jgi:MFS family permease
MAELTSAAPATAPRLLTGPFVRLWIGTFLFYLSFYLLLPVTPLYAAHLGGRESEIGYIIGVFALTAMVLKPISGVGIDRWGRRPILLAGAMVFFTSSLLYGLARSVRGLMALRSFHGIGMGLNPTAATAMATDLAPPERRGEAMGYFGAGANVALAVGPALGIWIVNASSFQALFFYSAAVALVSVGTVWGLRETGRPRADVGDRVAFSNMFSRAAVFPAGITLALYATYGGVISFLPLFVGKGGLGNPGLFFTVYALVLAAARPVAGILSDRFGRAPVIAPGMFLVGLSLVGLSRTETMAGVLWVGAGYGLGFAMAQPTLMAMSTDRLPAEERGRALGTFYTAWELGIGGGSIVMGKLLSATSFPVMFRVMGGIAVVGGVTAWLAGRPVARRRQEL